MFYMRAQRAPERCLGSRPERPDVARLILGVTKLFQGGTQSQVWKTVRENRIRLVRIESSPNLNEQLRTLRCGKPVGGGQAYWSRDAHHRRGRRRLFGKTEAVHSESCPSDPALVQTPHPDEGDLPED